MANLSFVSKTTSEMDVVHKDERLNIVVVHMDRSADESMLALEQFRGCILFGILNFCCPPTRLINAFDACFAHKGKCGKLSLEAAKFAVSFARMAQVTTVHEFREKFGKLDFEIVSDRFREVASEPLARYMPQYSTVQSYFNGNATSQLPRPYCDKCNPCKAAQKGSASKAAKGRAGTRNKVSFLC